MESLPQSLGGCCKLHLVMAKRLTKKNSEALEMRLPPVNNLAVSACVCVALTEGAQPACTFTVCDASARSEASVMTELMDPGMSMERI